MGKGRPYRISIELAKRGKTEESGFRVLSKKKKKKKNGERKEGSLEETE